MSQINLHIREKVYGTLRLAGPKPLLCGYEKTKVYHGGREEGAMHRLAGRSVKDLCKFKSIHDMFHDLKKENLTKMEQPEGCPYLVIQMDIPGLKQIFVFVENVQGVTFKILVDADGDIALETTYAQSWSNEVREGKITIVKPVQCFSCGSAQTEKSYVGCATCKKRWFFWCDADCERQDKESHCTICNEARLWRA